MQEQNDSENEQIDIKETELLINKDKEFQIDLALILKTSIDQNFIDIMTEDQKTNELMSLKTIHLEFLNIRKIENLELFDKLQILFLQHNKISEIENLDTLINLEYLSLKNNQISILKGLKNSKKLAFLDISENQINSIIFEQVPQMIEILNISNNPIETNVDIRKSLLCHLKLIDEIDSVKIDQNERFQALGIFPKELESYQKKLTQRKMKKIMKFKKIEQVLDVDKVEIKEDELIEENDNLTENTIHDIHNLTESLITKAQQSNIEKLYQVQQELLEYQKLHQEIRIKIYEEQIQKQQI
ncbi:unnamed protein product [Paramecium pentaurelia]|uniref:Leucine rich repeat protein n=1 Tax=Paramecium pentaurelia TaxID=43138 RepID=A0A8S1UKY2_9CILI|nr:unnamed protein product [Paramecium pentaurelia]